MSSTTARALGLLITLAATSARADGPADNDPGQVRPVPPAGMTVDAATRSRLEAGLRALAAALAALPDRTGVRAFWPDAQIFHDAVATALHHDEFFAPKELAKAERLLELGRARATALSRGRAPWRTSRGSTALGYVSDIDGSVQPYGLFVPYSWSPRMPGRYRLDTWFHGRGETLSELNFIDKVLEGGGPFVRPDTFVIQPYGRYCNGSKFAGETDFFEALADVQAHYPIDEDRIVIRGFSLGGATSWHLGAHHAWRWAAVAPGAGFAETAEFLRVFQNEPVTPPWWEQKLWQLYDAPAYAENFRNVPLVAYSGEVDRQKQAADVMTRALAGVGVELTHVIGPGTAHKYHPESERIINDIVDRLARKGRDVMPSRVSLTTPTLRYNRQAWVQVDGLERHWEKSLVSASIGGETRVDVSTKGVEALTLTMPPGQAPFAAGGAIAIHIDRQRLAGPPLASDRSWQVSLHRVKRTWQLGARPDAELRKRHGLQGPIDDAFMSSFLVVTPSGQATHAAVGQWANAELDRFAREWRRHFRGQLRRKADRDVTDDDLARHNLVLFGDPSANTVLGRIATQLPIAWGKNDIAVGAQRFAAETAALVAIYPNPLNPRRYVVLNSGFSFREYDYLNNARQVPKLPDWAVVDVTVAPDSRHPGGIAAAGFFGERWELLPSR